MAVAKPGLCLSLRDTKGGEAISTEQKGRLLRRSALRNDRVKGSYLITAKLPCILIFISIRGIIVPRHILIAVPNAVIVDRGGIA